MESRSRGTETECRARDSWQDWFERTRRKLRTAFEAIQLVTA